MLCPCVTSTHSGILNTTIVSEPLSQLGWNASRWGTTSLSSSDTQHLAQAVLAKCVRYELIDTQMSAQMWEALCFVTVIVWANTNLNMNALLCANRASCDSWLQRGSWPVPHRTRTARWKANASTLLLYASWSPGCSAHVQLTTGEQPAAKISLFKPPTSPLLLALILKGAKEKKAFFLALNKMITEASPLPLVI